MDRLRFKEPARSSLRICRHVEWSRRKGLASAITPGFKNSKAVGGVKTLPIFPKTFRALKSLHSIGAKGLVFRNKGGSFFSYRQIQNAYERAFARAGVPFHGTHSLRHEGCNLVYNQTGDRAVASQILGNEDPDTVKVYAKRESKALWDVSRREWEASAKGNAAIEE